MIKSWLKKIIPPFFLLFYHYFLSILAAFLYGQPSQKLIVIGVTGTAGKSTVVHLIGRILEEAGYRIGWISTINFKIAEKEWFNKTKMTMPGRFFLQKLLKRMVLAHCQYAIIETSSEGILQFRHLGINYDVAVFTNLFPEHLERHGSFENYKKTKGKLFQKLKDRGLFSFNQTKIIHGQEIKKIIIANLDDAQANYFLSFFADEKWGYQIKSKIKNQKLKITTETESRLDETNLKFQVPKLKIIEAEEINLEKEYSEFKILNSRFKIHLVGEFNISNALAAISAGLSQNIPLTTAQKGLEKVTLIPGRMEVVVEKPFKVIVDYAHTPDELEKVYQTLKLEAKKETSLICVLGACGGGRDKWKRPVLGQIAARYCQKIILTNEDPYDEDPDQILSEIKSGISNFPTRLASPGEAGGQFPTSNLYEILDRRKAIRKALNLAKENDLIVITGKGCEAWICLQAGKKISWDDRQVVKEEIKKIENEIN